MTPFRTALRRLAAAATAAALALPAAGAGLPDDPAAIVSIDVLPGWVEPDGTRMAALHLRLAPGWKTYWRAPGETGVPPQFDWSGSRNLHAVRVHWPRPTVYDEDGLRTIGYAEELVLPVELFPRDPAAPTSLSGQMAFGVCQQVCIPVTLPYAAELVPGMEEGGGAVIRAALARRPVSGAAAGGPARCTLEPIADGLRIEAAFEAANQGGTEVVVLEPGRDDLWVSQPEVSRRGGTVIASADIVPPEAAPFALARGDIRITLIGRDGAVEYLGCQGS